MVAINKILLPVCTGEEFDGETDICTDSRIHHCNSENRAPVTRNHRSTPGLRILKADTSYGIHVPGRRA
jgi:hypothetical protein